MPADVAILCPGPSLASFLAAPTQHELFIGVNRAASAWPCQWWAFNDAEVFGWFRPTGRPKIFTSNESFKRIEDKRRADHFRWTFYPAINTTCPSDPGWTNFSMTVAMVLAEYLGARAITIYGCDWEGADDWDGPADYRHYRQEYRWKNEIHKVGHVIRWLESRGVSVERVVPQPKTDNCELRTPA